MMSASVFSSGMGRKPLARTASANTIFRPAMTLVSTYTGYTGSGMSTVLQTSKISRMFPKSDLAPSETKISSAAREMPRRA